MKQPTEQRPIWVIAQQRTQLTELRRVVRVLATAIGDRVQLFVENPDLLDEPGSKRLPTSADQKFVPWRTRVAQMVRKAVVSGCGSLPKGRIGSPIELLKSISIWVNHYANLVATAEGLITEMRPAAIVIAEDGLGGNFPLVTAANKLGIPVYIVPYEYSTRRQIRQHLESNPQVLAAQTVSTRADRIFARLFPKWVDEWVDPSRIRRRVFRWPLHYALPLEWLGLAIRNPWTVHGGGADCLCVESPHMLVHYRREGIPEQKLRLTGSIALDDLYQEMMRAGPEKGTRRQIVCAFPPDYVAFRSPPDFATYRDLIEFWKGLMESANADVIYQAHPAARAAIVALGLPDLHLKNIDISTLIANCDILVTTVSSIIRLAIAAGKPVLNFDVYRFDYEDYREVDSVITISTKADFVKSYTALTSDADLYDRTARCAKAEAPRWGALDGLAGERIKSLVLQSESSRSHPQRQ